VKTEYSDPGTPPQMVVGPWSASTSLYSLMAMLSALKGRGGASPQRVHHSLTGLGTTSGPSICNQRPNP